MKSSIFAAALSLSAFAAGLSSDDDVSTIKVVGGEDAGASDFRFIVSIESTIEGEEGHYCGGTLMNEWTVLTAAHCLVGENAGSTQVRAGHRVRNTGGVTVGVTSFWRHPKYNSTTTENDIALIELDEPIEKTKNITYATLAAPKNDPKAGLNVTVAGWGHTKEDGDLAVNLQKASFAVVARDECRKKLKSPVTNDMFCAGTPAGGIDSCQGDSGGPLINAENGNVIGVVSWGYGCARADSPGVYARVGYFREQINAEAWYPANKKRWMPFSMHNRAVKGLSQ
ncbi:unnamed protein product [Clonostachys rosea f. rosea IK726]|uniref:Peptidase S1 domain-containing protein n=2 Tax=Bionectria ochroleuca TaxID=29856 RepID=A0A0B7K4T9_BIOOC|nr:unnamed protein product [Clonostachys rosea f. rosea IK726]